MPDEHAALQDLLSEDPNQYLVANALFLGALPVYRGAPGLRPLRWVAVSAVPLLLSSEDTTFFGPVPVEPGQDPKAANRAANAQFAAATQPAADRLDEVLAELGAERAGIPFGDAIYTMADEAVVLTVPGFEFERSDLPETVHLAGNLPYRGVREWNPPAWWEKLDGSRPVVVVTQGTLANEDFSELVEPTLAGLADANVTVIAALGRDPEELSLRAPANAYLAEFVPFDMLLPKTDVFITNGGSGATHQALAAGVPVVMAGETEDKPANAMRVAHHGLGINLQTATPAPQAVADAVESLLHDAGVRDNVARLAKVYAKHDALATIEYLLLR
jgi:hypothetical protein